MTGGMVYLKLDEALGLDEAALRRRLAKGAEVEIVAVGAEDEKNLRELLTSYLTALSQHEQKEEAEALRRLWREWQGEFMKAVPKKK
jgi:glutamate synthase (NADPH/NADH) large chain